MSKKTKKINVAFVGTGGYMGVHAQRLRTHPEVQLVGMCDLTEAIANGFIDKHLKEYPARPPVFTDAAAMYAKTKPDAVFIATPHTLHFQMGMQALDAGLHVYMEKPMVTRLEDAYALKAKVEKTGKTLVVGYNSPSSPEFQYLRDVIRDKTLGNLEMVHGYISQDWMKGTVGKWRQDPALSGGGQAYDSGAHLLNSLCWAVNAEVDHVFALVDNHGTKVDINVAINVKFVNGVVAAMTVSGNCPSSGNHTVFIFDGGRVEIDGWSGGWINVWKGDKKVKYPAIAYKEQTPDENFIDALLGRATPATNPQNGIVHSQLMDAIYESARTGQAARPKRQK